MGGILSTRRGEERRENKLRALEPRRQEETDEMASRILSL